jgi:glyoxalase family protein
MNRTDEPQRVHGLHHVTCIAGDPRRNLGFYTGTIGLRLVKKSVNQDDPATYHLFYADAEGRPGTDLTFFPWPRLPPARHGAGHAVEVAFSVDPGGLAYWAERLAPRDGGRAPRSERRFGDPALAFEDPDGLPLVLIETGDPLDTTPWPESPVPVEHQLRGFHGVRLLVRSLSGTARFLTEVLGYEEHAEDAGWHRFGLRGAEGVGGPGSWVEVREDPGARLGEWGTGGIHHVAFRVEDDAEQLAVRSRVSAAGRSPTPVIDRFWFRSVYFKEPGGVLFELATVEPGFTVDEDPEHLGERLILPPWLEPRRREIEAALPPLPEIDPPVSGL